MHGKGGSPGGYVEPLAAELERKGFLVANIEMPWSRHRSYDATVADAVTQVSSALEKLRSSGAAQLFVAGHSQGGLFALYVGGQVRVDGIVAIAPGGNAASPANREKLGASVAQARKLIAEGRGANETRFLDFEGSRGTYPIVCTPEHYLSWFDPDGAMNETSAVRNMNPAVPVLFIAPTGDYPALQRSKQLFFGALPPNPLTKLYEPLSSHLDAPAASAAEVERWLTEVVSQH